MDNSSNGSVKYSEDFTFTLLNGSKQSTSFYEGKVLIIDFTGVHCGWCIPQMFVLHEIYNDYKDDDVEVLSINVWTAYGETIEDVNKLFEAFECKSPCDAEDYYSDLQIRETKEYFGYEDGVDFEWTYGMDDSSGTISSKYKISGVPHIMILDKKGNIYYTKAGYTQYNGISEKLDEIIN
jgi:thiol-disulfide isomerase/thioredoxin